jgi:hypothetical protein
VITARNAGIAGAVAALVAGIWFATRPGDEARIREQLEKLSRVVHITDDDMQTNALGRLAHVNDALKSLVDHDVRVSVPEVPQIGSGRQELAQLITGAPRYLTTFDVDFKSVTIKLDDARVTAAVGATGDVSAHERGGRVRDDQRAIDFRFAKQDGAWIITTITVWAPDDAPAR